MECYVDASYSSKHHIGVLGFYVQGEDRTHIQTVTTSSSTSAEKLALARCIEHCSQKYPNTKLIIYIDCKGSSRVAVPNNIQLQLLPGHMKKANMDAKQLIFSKVDRLTRKILRKTVNGEIGFVST